MNSGVGQVIAHAVGLGEPQVVFWLETINRKGFEIILN